MYSSRHTPEEVGGAPKVVGDESITFLELLS